MSNEAIDATVIAAFLALPRESRRKLLAFFHLAPSRHDISVDVSIEADGTVELRLRYREHGACDPVEDEAQPQNPSFPAAGEARSPRARGVGLHRHWDWAASLIVQYC